MSNQYVQLEFDFNTGDRLLTFSDANKCPHNHDPNCRNSELHDVWNIFCPGCYNIHFELYRGVSQIMDWDHQAESIDKLVRKWNKLVDKESLTGIR